MANKIQNEAKVIPIDAPNIFGQIEPLPTSDMLGNFWRFVKSLPEADRLKLGPIEVATKSGAVIKGFPVALKNHVMALSSDAIYTPESSVAFVEVQDVSSIRFYESHRVLPYLTDGGIARSPFVGKINHEDAKASLHSVCESLRLDWSVRLFFEVDPTQYGVDELLNLTAVLNAIHRVVVSLDDGSEPWAQLQDFRGMHVINDPDAKGLSLVRRSDEELELAFRFARALPGNLNDTVLGLFNSIA